MDGTNFNYVCSYQVANLSETRRECGRPAIRLVTWPKETDWGIVTYCKMHFDGVEPMLNTATEVVDVTPEAG